MYASTTHAFEQLADAELAAGEWPVTGLMEPQVEAEIAFRFADVPRAGADERELLASIDGVSHTLEVVRCPYPGWVFRPSDTMAAAGLHGGLAVGPWHPIEPADRDDWARALTTFSLTILSDDGVEGTGQAQNVLGGPLSALKHFIDESARLRGDVLIRPGDIVTTGTVPPAYPVRSGQHWTTEVDGLPLPGLSLTAV
jgi:2-oxo-3-hexenedioate decarboxylase